MEREYQPEVSPVIRGHHTREKMDLARQMRREMTSAENGLWHELRRNQLDGLHFRRQQVIDGFIVDFYCSAALLVIEVDGQVHDDNIEYDRERDQILEAHNLHVVRFTNLRIINELDTVLNEIMLECRKRISQPHK